MRGNLAGVSLIAVAVRSIPAYAGEPAVVGGGDGVERVYPRVCGGTAGQPLAGSLGNGLSPRMRGNRAVAHCRRACPGSIPAYAGEPGLPQFRRRGGWVYPRVCGGTYRPCPLQVVAIGLSPRMRGNRVAIRQLPASAGSIPAYAGEPI